jgi:hypothetical protein
VLEVEQAQGGQRVDGSSPAHRIGAVLDRTKKCVRWFLAVIGYPKERRHGMSNDWGGQ